MSSGTATLLAIYIAAAIVEVLGIVLTVGTYVDMKNNGGIVSIDVRQPKTKLQAVRGPGLIGIGVLIGLTGNILSLFLTR